MSCILELKIFPVSGRQQILRDKSGIIKLFIKSVPEDGKANKEVIDFIARSLKISKHDIEIVHGLTDRKKKLLIRADMILEQCLEKLGLSTQTTFLKG